MRALLAAAFLAAAASRCAAMGEGTDDFAMPQMQMTSGLVLYYNSTGPMSFLSMTPRDVPAGARLIPEVRGVTCQRGVSIPTAVSINATDISGVYGDGGYVKSLKKIVKAHPDVAGIYDVRVDLEIFSVLGFYRSTCTIVTARAFALPSAATALAPAPAPAKS
ncbi:MAG: hypothetical protein HKL90_08290 [Elusimicrobia bacterium]|nr:hypothetical protein [Elusimicrobiota bacterium]